MSGLVRLGADAVAELLDDAQYAMRAPGESIWHQPGHVADRTGVDMAGAVMATTLGVDRAMPAYPALWGRAWAWALRELEDWRRGVAFASPRLMPGNANELHVRRGALTWATREQATAALAVLRRESAEIERLGC